jgi:hypothetical protein
VSLLMVFHALGSTEFVEDVVLRLLEVPQGRWRLLFEAARGLFHSQLGFFLRFGRAKSSLYTFIHNTFIHNIR